MQNLFTLPTSGNDTFIKWKLQKQQQQFNASNIKNSLLASKENNDTQETDFRIQQAVTSLQRIGRASLERDVLSMKGQVKKVLTILSPFIPLLNSEEPITSLEVEKTSELLTQRKLPTTTINDLKPLFLHSFSQNNSLDSRNLLIPLRKLPNKSGAFKIIEPAVSINYSPLNREFSAKQQALIYTHNNLNTSDKEKAFRGLKNLDTIISEAEKQNVSINVFSTTPRSSNNTQYLGNWAHSNFYKALKNPNIAISFDPKIPKKKITGDNILKGAYEIANTLGFFHKNGFAHRDLKADNILLFYDKINKEFNASLTDFDFLHKFGWDPETDPSNYRYWDPLAVCNIHAPTVDVYGMVILMNEIWSSKPNYKALTEIRNDVMRTMILGKTPTFNFNFKTQDPNSFFEAKLKLVCYQSMLILLSILKKAGINLAEEVKNSKILPFASSSDDSDDDSSPPTSYIGLLKKLTFRARDHFTQQNIIEATAQAEQDMINQDLEPCTLSSLISILKKTIEERKANNPTEATAPAAKSS